MAYDSYHKRRIGNRTLRPETQMRGFGYDPRLSEGSLKPVWQRVERIPAEELWRTHERRRERLTAFARRRLRAQLEQSNASPSEIEAADEVLTRKH